MYTLVCYRPEGVETCRGQVMSESASEFKIHYFEKVQDAAMQEAALEMINSARSREYSEWEVTLLVDGLDREQWWNIESNYDSYKHDVSNIWDNYGFHLKNSISILQEQIEQNCLKQEQEEQRTSELIKVALRVKEENERLEFERLSKKFGELK